MTELQILSAVKNSGGKIQYTDLLNMGKTDFDWDIATDRDLIKKLIKTNKLSGQTDAYCVISFGEEGRVRLQELRQKVYNDEKLSNDNANQERKAKRHAWAMNIAITFFGAILGIVGTILSQFIFG